MTIDVQVGTCNSLPVVVTVPATGMLPINFKVVKLAHTFYKDAPADFYPYRFVPRPRTPPYSRPWQQGLQSGMAGAQTATDEAGRVYPYFDFLADKLIALGVAQYVTGPVFDIDARGRDFKDWMVLA